MDIRGFRQERDMPRVTFWKDSPWPLNGEQIGRQGDLLGTLGVVHMSCDKSLNQGCAVEIGGDRFERAFRGRIE